MIRASAARMSQEKEERTGLFSKVLASAVARFSGFPSGSVASEGQAPQKMQTTRKEFPNVIDRSSIILFPAVSLPQFLAQALARHPQPMHSQGTRNFQNGNPLGIVPAFNLAYHQTFSKFDWQSSHNF